jgi:hypothetical protein
VSCDSASPAVPVYPSFWIFTISQAEIEGSEVKTEVIARFLHWKHRIIHICEPCVHATFRSIPCSKAKTCNNRFMFRHHVRSYPCWSAHCGLACMHLLFPAIGEAGCTVRSCMLWRNKKCQPLLHCGPLGEKHGTNSVFHILIHLSDVSAPQCG